MRSQCSSKRFVSYSINEAHNIRHIRHNTWEIHTGLDVVGELLFLIQEVGGTKNGLVIFTQMTTTEALQIHYLRMIHIEIHLKKIKKERSVSI